MNKTLMLHAAEQHRSSTGLGAFWSCALQHPYRSLLPLCTNLLIYPISWLPFCHLLLSVLDCAIAPLAPSHSFFFRWHISKTHQSTTSQWRMTRVSRFSNDWFDDPWTCFTFLHDSTLVLHVCLFVHNKHVRHKCNYLNTTHYHTWKTQLNV